MDKEDAFGFLDPNDILRAAHVIPAFKAGSVPLTDQGCCQMQRMTKIGEPTFRISRT